jgi:endonuclease/exonuclease/phosphatase family metal-dependent hydrolase
MKTTQPASFMGKRCAVAVILLLSVAGLLADSIKVCSFNIQFLGNSKKRDNGALAELVKDFDLVVIQELIAPPYAGTFPDGTSYKPDKEASAFFDEMKKSGFTYALSEEDTGTGNRIHLNSSATEWWVVFFKTNAVMLAPDLPTGFLAEDRSNHPDYERVPFAFGFRSNDRKMDFVLISVHLMPGSGHAAKDRRKHELGAIGRWISAHNQQEKDFIILGDMNIEDFAELSEDTPPGLVSLNANCLPTNTNVRTPKPYDHVMFSRSTTGEMDSIYGFRVINLIDKMRAPWRAKFPTRKYPGDPPYNHDTFRAYYSDHDPVEFRLTPLSAVDDD